MKSHPLINFNPCLPTFKLTMLNYQGSFMTINPFLYFHDYINTVIIFPKRSLLEHIFSEIKTKTFCLNFFHCTYFYIFKIDSILEAEWHCKYFKYVTSILNILKLYLINAYKKIFFIL